MRFAKICLCSVQCLLLLLILIPQACALEQERALPDPAAQAMSQVATPAPGPTIEDVWLQNGGARLYYSALYGARQQYTGGASRIDPACSPLLPPMRAWGAPEPKKKVSVRSRKVAAANPCPEVNKVASSPAKAATAASKASAVAAGTKAAPKASTVNKANTSKAAAKAAQSKAAVTDKKNGAGTTKPLNTTPKPNLPAEPKP